MKDTASLAEKHEVMHVISPPLSPASRRRLARRLVGLSLRDVERDLILETLSHTHGNRTVAARLLGISVRTLRNKIAEYSAEGLCVPRRETRDEILCATPGVIFSAP